MPSCLLGKEESMRVLTSSASFPARGCGSAGSPGAAWCPGAQPLISGIFSLPAAESVGSPPDQPAGQQTAPKARRWRHGDEKKQLLKGGKNKPCTFYSILFVQLKSLESLNVLVKNKSKIIFFLFWKWKMLYIKKKRNK